MKTNEEYWQCSRRKCGWVGIDDEKKEQPDEMGSVLICPECGCDSFYHLTVEKYQTLRAKKGFNDGAGI